jgi:DNA-binding HxlR family transcriptional regulator
MDLSPSVSARCPVRTALELTAGKWKLLIVQQLAEGPLRFHELKARIPEISEKMLAQELKAMTQSGLLLRQDPEEGAPRIEYALSEIGEELRPLIGELTRFGKRYHAHLRA